MPRGIAAEIRAGIAEELSSLDRGAAERRIRQLGDPRVIAREERRGIRACGVGIPLVMGGI